MRYISDNTPPQELILWLREQRKAGMNLRYDDLTPVEIEGEQCNVREAIIEQRLKDQGYLCAYTMIPIDAKKCHVEHIYPRSLSYKENDPEKSVEYANMVACFPLQEDGKKKAKCPFGAEARENNLLDLHPLDPSCETRIRYRSNGAAEATTPDDEAAKALLLGNGKLIRLNHSKLIQYRQAAINEKGVGLKSKNPLKKSQAERLKKAVLTFSRGQKLEAYCVAIAHAAEEHIQRLEKRRKRKQHIKTARK